MKLFTHLVAGSALAAALVTPAYAVSVLSTETPAVNDADAKTDIFTIIARHDKPSDALTYETTFHINESGWASSGDADIGYVHLHYKNDATVTVHSYVSAVSSGELAAVGCSNPYGTIDTETTAHTGAATGVKVTGDPGIITQGAYLHIMKGACKLPDGLYHIDVTVKTYSS